MKPNPYFRDDKERLELLALRDAFQFSDPKPSKLFILIAGREGSGKTHLACTMRQFSPVYLIDTEYRANIVTRKFEGIKLALAKNFQDMAVAVKHILKYQPPGTIVIDSGSDFQTFAEVLYLERTKQEKVYPVFNWSEVWGMCNALIDDIKFDGRFDLVITSRVKEEYVNDRPTGQIVPRIYSTLPYKADIVLQFGSDKGRKLAVTKNGFRDEEQLTLERGRTLPQIIDLLSQSDLKEKQPETHKRQSSVIRMTS